ncbi:MAG: single-stranded DNA-binding protein [Chitinophagales bacterium]|jgi:single-strand DNA-binding protein|nr:single-stranded DNA-binding protein [Sphingobacteriales bacterium]
MVNKVILLGRVGKDPEVKQFDNGSIANFTIATNDNYKDKSGQKVERTDWHNIAIGSPGLVDLVSKYVKKGDLLYVEGKIRTREYEKEGQKRYLTEVRVDTLQLMPKGQAGVGSSNSNDSNPEQKSMSSAPNADFVSDAVSMDDDLPF